MKPNDPHHWSIMLCAAPRAWQPAPTPKLFQYTGDIEGALEAADVMESNVDFEVEKFIITRGTKANT